MGRRKKIAVEVTYSPYRSAFDPKNAPEDVAQLFKDKTKDLRWVDSRRIDERKNAHGYVAVPGNSSEGTYKVKGMTLMQRSRELAEESRKQKEQRTQWQQQATRTMLRDEAERLSKATGKDVHQLIKEDIDTNH